MYMFKIEGLNCMGCFHKIEDSLKEFDANISAKADVPSKTISIESSHSAEQVTKLIEAAGYVAKILPTK